MLDPVKLQTLTTNVNNLAQAIKSQLDARLEMSDLPVANSIVQVLADGTLGGLTLVDDSYFIKGSNPEDIAIFAGTELKFRTVFNSWGRVALGAARAVVASETEAGNFRYQFGTERIVGTTASSNTAGFVDIVDRKGDYTFEVELSGTSGTGMVGILLGFVKDTEGTAHTLTAMRNMTGVAGAPKFGLYLDIGDSVSVPTPLAGADTGLTGVDWSAGPVRIQVVKVGNTLTLRTNNNGTAFVSVATLTFDLSTNPLTAPFAQAWRHGFVCLGQATASWNIIRRTMFSASRILDYVANNVQAWNGTAWVVEAGKVPGDYAKPNRLYYSRGTKKVVFIKPDGVPIFFD